MDFFDLFYSGFFGSFFQNGDPPPAFAGWTINLDGLPQSTSGDLVVATTDASMNTVTIKAKDKAITFESTLTKNGAVLDDLDSATSVKLLMQSVEAPYTKYSFDAEVVSATSGTVKCVLPTGFPTVAATYRQEWEVMYPSTKPLTFPSDGYNIVTIIEDLN